MKVSGAEAAAAAAAAVYKNDKSLGHALQSNITEQNPYWRGFLVKACCSGSHGRFRKASC
jgi:hypothetical protein